MNTTDPQPALAEQLPEKSNPTDVPVEGVVAPTAVVPRDEEAAAAVIRDLAKIGAHVQGSGVLRVARGRAVVNQQWLDRVMRDLAAAITEKQQKPKKSRADFTTIAKLADTFGYLASQLTASQRLLLEFAERPSPSEADAPKPLNSTFPPGAIVGPQASWTPIQRPQGPCDSNLPSDPKLAT